MSRYTNFALEWLDIVPRCQEHIVSIKFFTPHFSRKIRDLAHCGLSVSVWFVDSNISPCVSLKFALVRYIFFLLEFFFVKRRIDGRCLGVGFLAWLQPRNYHFIKCSGGSTSISYIHDSLQSVMACKKGRILMSVCVKCFLLDCHLTIVRWTEF